MNPAAKLLSAIPARARQAASEQELAKGALLFAQGTRPKSMHCVLFGEIRLLRTTSAGAEIILQRSREGFVAESSLDQAAYHCNAVAITRSRVLAIPATGLSKGAGRSAFQRRLDCLCQRGIAARPRPVRASPAAHSARTHPSLHRNRRRQRHDQTGPFQEGVGRRAWFDARSALSCARVHDRSARATRTASGRFEFGSDDRRSAATGAGFPRHRNNDASESFWYNGRWRSG